jgi:transcription elongation GreA/GreB family factor
MSRAFVKETDDVPELPDRPISEHPNLVTAEGLAKIEAEVERYMAMLAEARAAEDRDRIAAASREVRYWTARRQSAEVQPKPETCDIVRFGCRVTIERDDGREQVYRIVGEDEADPSAGLLSYVAPLARALIGKSEGDVVTAGQSEAEIVRIEA